MARIQPARVERAVAFGCYASAMSLRRSTRSYSAQRDELHSFGMRGTAFERPVDVVAPKVLAAS
jgi:hypothetical protein